MGKKGRIVQSTGSWYKVAVNEDDTLEIVNCRLPGRFRLEDYELTNPVAVGDYVSISMNEDGTGSIEEIRDRDNYVMRQATHGRQGEQILASNIDLAIVVQSVRKPALNEGFIDRFLVTCEAYELKAVVLINKMDLSEHPEDVEELAELYRSLGYGVLLTSIYDDASLEKLKELLKGETSVFIGPSGTGKTSLLNAIAPGIERRVADISEYSQKGKHTTTYAKLLPLPFGGYLVDTPGIREFGLVNIEPWELSHYFPEMVEAGQRCKFNNCTHSHEPGCGVIEAYENGEIDPQRYHSYLQMLEGIKD